MYIYADNSGTIIFLMVFQKTNGHNKKPIKVHK